MAVKHFKCPTCGADLGFNPETGSLLCEYCGSEFTAEELDKLTKSTDEETQATEEEGEEKQAESEAKETDATASTDETEGNLVAYKCSFCGAEVVTAEDTAATHCVYCHRPLVIESQLTGEFKPKKLIPFKTTRNDAIKSFKEYLKKKPLTPSNFAKDVNIQKIMGVYVPFWLLDCITHEVMSGTGKNIRRWSDSNYRYTKTDTYSVEREGTLSMTDIPADASKKIDDNIMDTIEPFDYSEFKPYSPAYLSGFLAQRWDQSLDDVKDRLKGRAEQSMKNKIDDTCNYTTISHTREDIDFQKEEYEYAMLPVWLLYTEYEGKFYPFAMNGQTGKFIGDLPIDKIKAVLHGIASFLIGTVLGVGVFFFI